MSDRTIGNNRLVDGAKLDAVSLNASNKINATSIADGSVTDSEFLALNGVSGNIRERLNSIGGAPLTGVSPKPTTDVRTFAGTPSYDGTCVVITNGSTVTKFCPGYERVFNGGELTTYVPMSGGTYDGGTKKMTYADGFSISSETGEVVMPNRRIAYRTASNTFASGTVRTFNGSSVFNGQVSLPFYDIGSRAGAVSFVGTNGMNRKVTLTGASGHTINFTKMAPAVYRLFVVREGTGTVSLGTVTDSGTINATSVIGSTSFPLTLAAGSHILVFDVANVKVHAGYVGLSA